MRPYPLAACIFLVLLASTGSGDDAGFAAEATRRLAGMVPADSSGFAMLVARDGKVVVEGGFGLADLDTQTPITPQTKFRIGSVSKQFTAAAILRLAEQGKLALDDSLAQHFPNFAHRGAVTVRHLLTHTSGLHSYTEKPEFMTRVTAPIEPADLIAWFRDDPADFAPGEGFHYNNSAYFLLGEIVAKVSGQPLADYLRQAFFDPLEMNSTGVYVNATPPPGIAKGYSLVEGKLQPALDWDMSWAGGAGALYSTVGDLYRWNEALFGGRVLSAASLQAATTPVELPPRADGMKYGFGLMLLEVKRLPVIGHGGGLNGWSSELFRLPDQRCTIVVLANALPGPPQLSPGALAQLVVSKFLAEEINALAPPEEDKTVDPKTFKDYVGRYDYKSQIATFTVEGGALFAQLTDQPKLQIYPKGKETFFWKVADAEVTFVRDANGQVNAARHTQGGVTFTAPKLADSPVKLTPEGLDAIVGQYQYGPGVVMTASRDGLQLYAQLTGQPKMPIFPIAENEFEWRVVKAQVRFVKGDDGRITKAVHTQGGNTLEAPKVK